MRLKGKVVYPVDFDLEIPTEFIESDEDLRAIIKQQVDDFVQTDKYVARSFIVKCDSNPHLIETSI